MNRGDREQRKGLPHVCAGCGPDGRLGAPKLATYADLLALEVDIALSRHDIVRPDLSGWRKQRLPRPGSVRPIEIAPDWVCEILSPATAARDRVHKHDLYAHAGVAHYWLIDPQARVLEALAPRDGAWLESGVFGDDDQARIPPFEAIELEVGRLFLPRDADDLQEE